MVNVKRGIYIDQGKTWSEVIDEKTIKEIKALCKKVMLVIVKGVSFYVPMNASHNSNAWIFYAVFYAFS